MRKIAILSFFRSANYGAVLQALALQVNVNKLGYQSEYLSFEMWEHKFVFRDIFRFAYNNFVRSWLGFKRRKAKCFKFVDEYLFYSEPLKLSYQIEELEMKYDGFLVGSDQVWNPYFYNESNGFYLLDFIYSKPKMSYATSFAVNELPKSLTQRYKKSLSSFKFLSSRESSGCSIISKLGMSSQNVLDPTLLLNGEEWKKYFVNAPYSFHYVLCYIMPGDNAIDSLIKEVACAIGSSFQIIIIGDREHKRISLKYKYICDVGPSEFLNLMYNAACVVTNSFHGTCFSVNFNKPFYTILNSTNKRNSRVTDLLYSLDLSTQIIYTDIEKQSKIPKCIPELNYRKVNGQLNLLRKQSLEYLQDSLSLMFD
ncbi:polysaccharide pyruvyl transferase family protein [Bacteroides fragilis]|uniref:polysaccharide pyruvyl transferase family protein n=1 Tax=Bacteroides TaxID=816 RepID=UPI0020307B0F|nr:MULTISPECIES: polysaccharide pyruvyl transferase family protein [Bacteroides]MCM0323220.1 polysaccharide pyruvyl transferase family protein [Bacteroides fragilis]MCZ2614367.1 polysaccharide pyruvyl transferase family protein [Bacteroides fragilis]MCZ2625158.1 polysaccharide pyruvyl transferase family protein [Bacteroides fragilis]MDV6187502.1 polysaccharide pyruvyl transferase family protein [Bacteroides hominis (ex Liu et al. 2022)]